MEPESQMAELAKSMTGAHGTLKEVVFLPAGNKNILLIFSDGTILPTDCERISDGRGTVIQAEFMKYAFYGTFYKVLGQSPLEFLAFGYSGTGPHCLSSFLSAAEFKSTDVEKIVPPLRLRLDGSQICGVVQGEMIIWDDGMELTNTGMGEMPKILKMPPDPKTHSSSEKKKSWWNFWQ